MTCDQCEMLSINGLACHETGCPNAKKTWIPERETWAQFVACRECGCDIEVGESCDCMEPLEEGHAMTERKPTIYEALRTKLGREPTNAELCADVKRILQDGLIKMAEQGKLAHQKGRIQ